VILTVTALDDRAARRGLAVCLYLGLSGGWHGQAIPAAVLANSTGPPPGDHQPEPESDREQAGTGEGERSPSPSSRSFGVVGRGGRHTAALKCCMLIADSGFGWERQAGFECRQLFFCECTCTYLKGCTVDVQEVHTDALQQHTCPVAAVQTRKSTHSLPPKTHDVCVNFLNFDQIYRKTSKFMTLLDRYIKKIET
jgi:hypothetical protein